MIAHFDGFDVYKAPTEKPVPRKPTSMTVIGFDVGKNRDVAVRTTWYDGKLVKVEKL